MAFALAQPQQHLWERYLATEGRGTREDKLRTLNEFVAELLQSPEATWKRWALDLAARIVDDGRDIPVRRPLFERILFPALLEALDAKSPGSARWLAGLSQHLYRCPGDVRSRQQLIRVIADHLRHTLHELPAGVLFGADGATVPQCDELLAELDAFRSLVAVEGQAADFAPPVRECDYHFRSYRQYLLERPEHESYSAFLEARGGNPAGG